MFCFSIADHVTLPKRTGPFKCRAVHVHYACITSKGKRQIPLRTLYGLNWENEVYKSETKTNKTLRSVHFGVVVVELINCKCGGIVRNEIW